MMTMPNLLSLLRMPLALFFLQSNATLRAIAIIIAMITDGLDGFIARRFRMISRLGVFLDPLMDKFFVLFLLTTFIIEGKITYQEAAALICRDFSVVMFGLYLALSGKLAQYRFRAIWCGKTSTALQFIVLLLLNFSVPVPVWVYGIFVALGGLALLELYLPATARNAERS